MKGFNFGLTVPLNASITMKTITAKSVSLGFSNDYNRKHTS